jgi:hypothetical protein
MEEIKTLLNDLENNSSKNNKEKYIKILKKGLTNNINLCKNFSKNKINKIIDKLDIENIFGYELIGLGIVILNNGKNNNLELLKLLNIKVFMELDTRNIDNNNLINLLVLNLGLDDNQKTKKILNHINFNKINNFAKIREFIFNSCMRAKNNEIIISNIKYDNILDFWINFSSQFEYVNFVLYDCSYWNNEEIFEWLIFKILENNYEVQSDFIKRILVNIIKNNSLNNLKNLEKLNIDCSFYINKIIQNNNIYCYPLNDIFIKKDNYNFLIYLYHINGINKNNFVFQLVNFLKNKSLYSKTHIQENLTNLQKNYSGDSEFSKVLKTQFEISNKS